MKLFGFLHRPGWEHKDAAVRLRTVQEGTEPGLAEVLPELAQRDPDAEVRRAALKRVDDPVVLARRMRGDPDPRVAAVARERLVARLCAADLPHEQARAVLLDLPDPEVLAEVAVHAAGPELRRVALEHIGRPGLLFERCLNDPDPGIRHWLLQRIDTPEALERLSAAARRRDKALSRAARERMEALQLASGDPAALERRALELCERAGRLGRELPEDREQQLDALRHAWTGIAGRVSAALQTRTEGALEMAAAAITASRAPEPAPQPPAAASDLAVAGAADAAAAQPAAPTAQAGTAAAQPGEAAPDWPADAAGDPPRAGPVAPAPDLAPASGAGPVEAAAGRTGTAEPDGSARGHAAEALSALEAALSDDDVAAARSARERLQPGALDAARRRRLQRAEQRLQKLEQWQRWASHDVRRRLCGQVEALHGSGLHPDALATRLKELQAEWARLDALEGEAAPPADSGIARRFRALCHRAIRPARGYFEKRREVRAQHAGQVDALIAETSAALDAGAGGGALAALRRQVAEALRALDALAPEKRGEQGRALRGLLQRLDQAAGEAREQAALDKRRLLARLRRELGSADAEAALALARQAQAEWKRMARAARTTEDALWAELRTLVDPLFENAQAREQERRQQDAEAAAAADAVLQELATLADADAQRLAHADAHLESLHARWRALQPPEPATPAGGGRDGRGPGTRSGQRQRPGGERERNRPQRRPQHPLEDRYVALVARVQSARAQAAAARAREELDAIAAAGALLDTDGDAARRGTLATKLDGLGLAGDAREALERRRRALEQDAPASADPEAAEVLAVRAELVAELPSPSGTEALRRREQMQRLAARLEGAEQRAPRTQVRALLIELSAMEVAPGRRDQLAARILRAWDALQD